MLAPDHEHLAELRLSPRKKLRRPLYEIHLPDGEMLRGREGTVPSLFLWLVMLPLVLIYLIGPTLSDMPADEVGFPLRTAWKRPGGLIGRVVMTGSARGRFRDPGEGLDHRVAYAQVVAKYWKQ
ncbi:hypothetical protein AB0B79_01020 [Streptomyces sp. NPDC039022]|uniref:hypothetical protein n=1 Tax=unclassified Streptomyces TaxID=2593676 RepID=UPI0033EC1A78